jgi:thioredoxin reductase (NADPH)
MGHEFDLVVIGAGPAGLTAAIYAARARLHTLVLDESTVGGQVKTTHKVANYPGFPEDIKGLELAARFSDQATRFGAKIERSVEITDFDLLASPKRFVLDEEREITGKAVVIATGAKPRALGLEGEKRFRGRGVSYCATCDGAFFEGKRVHVIGGGNSAVEESLFLTSFAERVTIIHQFDHFQCEEGTACEALAHPKISVLWNSEPRAFLGDKTLERIQVENLLTHQRTELDTDGVFIFVGMVPQTGLLSGILPLTPQGYVETDESMATPVPGLFVAGDIRSKRFRQITTAVADGTVAALSAQAYLRHYRPLSLGAEPSRAELASASP